MAEGSRVSSDWKVGVRERGSIASRFYTVSWRGAADCLPDCDQCDRNRWSDRGLGLNICKANPLKFSKPKIVSGRMERVSISVAPSLQRQHRMMKKTTALESYRSGFKLGSPTRCVTQDKCCLSSLCLSFLICKINMTDLSSEVV